MPPAEPTLAALPNPVLRYFLATRPPFLSVTLVSALIGLATAYGSGIPVHPVAAIVTVAFALVAHAGINVLNDYYDALNGTDAINTERVFPFTGGSRFIQNGVLSMRETAIFGVTLVVLVILAGLWLTAVSASGLMWIGVAGLFVGWAYSAQPLKLNSRGLGELCVWAGFALIAIGADFVQRGSLSPAPLYAVAGYALLVTNILYINQFPDLKADATVGKHHWVVRLGAQRARWGYPLIAAAAYGWVVAACFVGILPWPALVSLLPAALSARAARDLARFAENPPQLAPAIQMTIGAATLHGLLLAGALAATRAFG
ncbi:MAG TPA: prenyltransferase [Casimicrobiaceae bacterium]